MIVDDNQMNLDLLAAALKELSVTAALNPLKALEIIKQEKFDLFLLDIMMPEMSGFDLAKEIKKSGINENAPVMFISALSGTGNKIKGYNLGSYAYIEKPFNIEVVRSQIYNILKTKFIQENLDNQKETFLAMVTHDLKSPVNAEISALKLLLGVDELDGVQREIISDILGAAKYMKNLVDNVLGKYKLENGTMNLHRRLYCLETLIAECIEEVKYLLNDKGQIPVFECKLQNSEINADYVELKRVIHNLLVNASEYGHKNTKIEMKLRDCMQRFVFSVKNYGSGIRASDPNEIFNKDFSSTEKRTGTGLGLYIAKRIIDAHGGDIKAKSKQDEYVKITFTLPKNICK